MPEITLVQINDSYAYLYEHPEAFATVEGTSIGCAGGYARIASLLGRWRSEAQVLFLDCGDTLHGTWPAVATAGAILPPLLNRLGLAAMSGHWEFAYGPAGFQERAHALDYPVLACNVYDEHSGAPPFSLIVSSRWVAAAWASSAWPATSSTRPCRPTSVRAPISPWVSR